MLKLGFIQILIETCKGTTIFYHVLRQSPWKALFHFLLLVLICTVAVWGYQSFALVRGVNTAYERLEKACGKITVSEKGMFPEKEPEKNRMIFSLPQLELTYVANLEAEIPKIDIGIAAAGVVWMPKALFFWFSGYDTNRYLVYTISNGKYLKIDLVHPDRMNAHLKEINLEAAKAGMVENSMPVLMLLNPLVLKIFLLASTLIGNGLLLFLPFFFLILMTSLIFSALGSRRLQGKLFFRDYFVLSCYIAFPCLLVSAVWLALGLKIGFLTYQWVSILSFYIYFMIVMGRIERWLSPPPPDNDGD